MKTTALVLVALLMGCSGGDGSPSARWVDFRALCIEACAQEAAAEKTPHMPYVCGPKLDGCSCVADGERACEVEFAFPDPATE